MEKRKISKNWKRDIKIFGNILAVLSILFLIRRVIQLNINFEKYFSSERVLEVIPITILFTLSMLLKFIPWRSIIFSLTGIKVSKISALKVTSKSLMMRYIPGNIFQFVGRAEIIGENEKLNISNIVGSLIVENAALACASLFAGFTGAGQYVISFFSENKVVLIIALFFSAIGIACLLFFRNQIGAFLQRKNIIISKKTIWTFIASVFFFYLIFVVQSFLLIWVMNIISGENYFYLNSVICGAYNLGWLAGYITPGASGGIGIRETILCNLLSGHINDEIVIVSVLLFRLINIIADLLAFCVAMIIPAKKTEKGSD